ncbi:MAG: transcription elongation factor GreA [Phycisphaerales bacterium]|nr:transcription elongation factor GreA [Phycisphaerales bacterium]
MEYITADDKSKLEEELSDRVKRRKEISDRIGRARELGDLKENGEYHAAREDQGMNEARIKLLEERLASAVVADTDDVPADMVFLGATVKLRDIATDDEDLYKLVGEASGRYDLDYVEVTSNSNLGQALMKTHVGEQIRVDLPRGAKTFEIVEIVS